MYLVKRCFKSQKERFELEEARFYRSKKYRFKSQKERFEPSAPWVRKSFTARVSNPRRNGLNMSNDSEIIRLLSCFKSQKERFERPPAAARATPSRVSNPRRNGLNRKGGSAVKS